MRPDADAVRKYVWEPLVDSGIGIAFAFGAPWFEMLEDHLGLRVLRRLGAGGKRYGSRVESRAVIVCEGPSGLRIIAEKHMGSSGPPAADEAYRLRAAIEDM